MAGDLVGQPCSVLIGETVAHDVFAGQHVRVESSSGDRWLRHHIEPQTDANGTVVGAAGVSIDITEAVTVPGVHAVLTHADVPGEKSYGLEFRDQPVLAIDRVRYFGEPVALLAAAHPEQARRAAGKIRVDYEPLEPVTDMERATSHPPLPPGSPSSPPTGPPRATATAMTRAPTSFARS